MKKGKVFFSSLSSVTILASMMFANTAWSASPCCFNGFFLGGQINGTQTNYDTNINNGYVLLDAVTQLVTVKPIKAERSRNSVNLGLQAGFSKTCGSFYMGAKIYQSFTENNGVTSKTKLDATTGFSSEFSENINLNVNRGFGVSLMPGWLVACDTLVYAEVGALHGRLSINTTDTYLAADGINETFIARSRSHANAWGLKGGIGIEKYMSDHFTAGFAINHTNYSKRITSKAASTTTSGILGVVQVFNKTKLHAFANTLEFNLNYRF